MYSDRKLNCNCKFIAIFILNRIGRGGYNCLSSTVSTSEEKSVRSKHRISFEDMYSCSIYCVDIKGKFHQQYVRKKRIQWTWEVALSPYLCQFRRLGIEFVDLEWFWNIPFSDVNGNWLHSITDAWNDMEWNWSMQLRTCSWRGQKLWVMAELMVWNWKWHVLYLVWTFPWWNCEKLANFMENSIDFWIY